MHSFQLNAHDMHERIPGTHLNGFSSYCGTKVSVGVCCRGRVSGASLMYPLFTRARPQDQPGSDNDSALSSAPPSLSPQPGLFSNSPDEWNLVSNHTHTHPTIRQPLFIGPNLVVPQEIGICTSGNMFLCLKYWHLYTLNKMMDCAINSVSQKKEGFVPQYFRVVP